MRARNWLLIGAALLLASGAAAWWWRTAGAGWRAKQVVLVTIDTLRADRLGVYGYRRRPSSPNLDAWAQSAVIFERASAPAPWTVPSLGALMTGRDPAEIGAYTNWDGIHADAETLAERFQQAGYATANFNTHALLVNKHGGFRQGFDMVEPQRIVPQLEGEHKAPFTATEPKLNAWLEAHRDQPFFVWIHDMSPHLPPTAGNPYFGKPEWGSRYDAEVRFVDDLLGRLFATLDRLGFGDDLLVIVTADHGEAFGDEHGLLGHQDVMYDEVLRIPLLVKYPRAVPRRIVAPVELVDLYATIGQLAGVPMPASTRSESLVPLLDGTRDERAKPFAFHARYFFEDGSHWLAVRDREWKLLGRTPELDPGDNRNPPRWSVADDDTTYLELYNVATDAAEEHDLYEQQPEQVARLLKVLSDWGESLAGGPQRPELDEATRESLRALGYE